ncbi:MAG TPA: hypothetical protein VGD52_19110 [Pseudoduganella sp.]|jgi:DNA-binding beta-propeller fold protein YncE
MRPYVYLRGGGNTVDVWNIYTVQKVRSVTLGVALGGMAVSPNGDRLYVYDRANHNVYILDTQTLATLSTWVLRGDPNGWGQLLAVRSNGEELLVTNNGDVLRVAGFQTLPSMQIEPGSWLQRSMASACAERIWRKPACSRL